jgi:hypothetical protein
VKINGVEEELMNTNLLVFIFVLQAASTVFSAGLDILEMYKPKPDRVTAFWTALQDMWLKLFGSSYPTVAAINVSSVAVTICFLFCHCAFIYFSAPSGKFWDCTSKCTTTTSFDMLAISEVLTAVLLKIQVFWDVTPCQWVTGT